MATRGIIATTRAQGWRGRYVHWDNYPDHRIPTITRLVARDGLLKVINTLINDNPSWSFIDPYQEPSTNPNDDYQKVVEGYGVVHTDVECDNSWFTEQDTDLAWAEYVYIMGREGLQVCKVEVTDGGEVAVPMSFYTWENLMAEVTV